MGKRRRTKEDEEEVITEEGLQNILDMLQDQYCLYCGCKGSLPNQLSTGGGAVVVLAERDRGDKDGHWKSRI